jgi:hypothetical protein
MKRIWNNERLELMRKISNKRFPEAPIKTLASMKRIVRQQEELHNVSIEQHNKEVLELNKQDEKDYA